VIYDKIELTAKQIGVIQMDNMERLRVGLQMDHDLSPAFKADLEKLTVPQLKAMVAKRRSTRGMTVKSHYIHAMLAWHRKECLKVAGYVQQ
jgi:hypothetical protein